MVEWLIALFIGAALGLTIGVRIARESNRKQPVRGGKLAQAFHYLACAGLSTMLPFIVSGLVLGLPFLALFGTALGCLALTAVFLLIYAGIERAAPSTAQ